MDKRIDDAIDNLVAFVNRHPLGRESRVNDIIAYLRVAKTYSERGKNFPSAKNFTPELQAKVSSESIVEISNTGEYGHPTFLETLYSIFLISDIVPILDDDRVAFTFRDTNNRRSKNIFCGSIL